MRRNLPHNDQSGSTIDPSEATVIALNDAGAIYDALASEIRGSAAGWPPGALAKLEQALNNRYGHLIGGPAAVQRLVTLAKEPTAA